MSIESLITDLIAALKENTAAHHGSTGSGTKPAAAAGKKPAAADKKATTVDHLAKKFSAYLAEGGDEAKTNVKKIVSNYDVKRVTEIPEESYDEALGYLTQYIGGEDPLGSGEDLM